MMLGEKLDKEVKHYLKAVCKGGGINTTAIALASGTAIVQTAKGPSTLGTPMRIAPDRMRIRCVHTTQN